MVRFHGRVVKDCMSAVPPPLVGRGRFYRGASDAGGLDSRLRGNDVGGAGMTWEGAGMTWTVAGVTGQAAGE